MYTLKPQYWKEFDALLPLMFQTRRQTFNDALVRYTKAFGPTTVTSAFQQRIPFLQPSVLPEECGRILAVLQTQLYRLCTVWLHEQVV
jgi:hypothetical protein